MLFAALYAWLRLLLDLVDVRLRVNDPEAELLLLRHQLRVVRRQVKRPRLEPADRVIMAALSRLVGRGALAGLLVRPETVLGWHRELVRRRWAAFGQRRGAGRPGLDLAIHKLILEMAKDNPGWGCVRIRGELIKLGYRVSATAIRKLLRTNRIGPAPLRSRLTWKKFLRAQASAILVSDFFSVDTVFLKRLYVLLYMELASRRIIWLAVSDRPDAEWVTQQARNLVFELEEEGMRARFLIHDHDSKFGGGSDLVFRSRRECLDWVLIVNRKHLERVLAEWVEHYNRARPHRGIELRTPIARSDPVSPSGAVRCRARLGGLLREYEREPLPVAA